MNIVDFLLARIAEDEAMAAEMAENAREVADCNEPHNAEIWTTSGVIDPARVLAECEAKRLIANDAQALPNDVGSYFAVKYLAAVYADHPDYNPAWRP